MGRARRKGGGSAHVAGAWPPELRDLQRRGGMSPDWHEATHGRGGGVGGIEENSFITSPYFKDVPEDLLHALTRRPLSAKERMSILDYLPPSVLPPLYDPVLQALWRNEWQRLEREGIVDPQAERAVQRVWYEGLESATSEQAGSAISPVSSFANSKRPTSALWAAVVSDDSWDQLADRIDEWSGEDQEGALRFVQDEILGSSAYLRLLQSRSAPLLGVPSSSFYESVWSIMSISRLTEDSPFYSPDDYSLEGILAELNIRLENNFSPEEIEALSSVPFYSGNLGVAMHGGSSALYALAMSEMFGAKRLYASRLRGARDRTVARCMLRLLDTTESGELRTDTSISSENDAHERFRASLKDFALGYGDNPLQGWSFVFQEQPERWNNIIRELEDNRSWATRPSAAKDFEDWLGEVHWSGRIEEDLLDFLENRVAP